MSDFLGFILFCLISYCIVGFWVAIHEEEPGWVIIWGPHLVRSVIRSCAKIWREF